MSRQCSSQFHSMLKREDTHWKFFLSSSKNGSGSKTMSAEEQWRGVCPLASKLLCLAPLKSWVLFSPPVRAKPLGQSLFTQQWEFLAKGMKEESLIEVTRTYPSVGIPSVLTSVVRENDEYYTYLLLIPISITNSNPGISWWVREKSGKSQGILFWPIGIHHRKLISVSDGIHHAFFDCSFRE